MGCAESKGVEPRDPPKTTAVGQTERMVNRAERLQQKSSNADSAGSRKHQTSSSVSPTESASDATDHPKLDAQGNLMPEEVVRRTTSSISSQIISAGTAECPIQIQYAHWTQRGYYPDDPHKENQDEFSITKKFAGSTRDVMLAVYDGHGAQGHDCARFAKKKLPQTVAKHLRQARVKKYQQQLKAQGTAKGAKLFDPQNWPLLTDAEYKACCNKAFLETNEDMHKSAKTEAKLSGTTAIMAALHGTMLTICNVGDSRAVLGHHVKKGDDENSPDNDSTSYGEEEKTEVGEDSSNTMTQAEKSPEGRRKVFPEDGKLLAIPLSRDQTPYRKDERERVKRLGAAIMSIDQMEGLEEMHENWGDMVLGEDVDVHGDPPRVWIEGKNYPGTAFTRSLGDYMAEEIGVTGEPEMLARNLTRNDHILVIASDGIFEFLTNQEVIDLVAASPSPIVACEALVKTAYQQWILYENRTDDITVIVCFLTCSDRLSDGSTAGTTEDLVDLAKSMYGSKPIIRKHRGGKPVGASSLGKGESQASGGGDDAVVVVSKTESGTSGANLEVTQ